MDLDLATRLDHRMDSLMKTLLERLAELEMRTAKLEAEVEHLKFLLRQKNVIREQTATPSYLQEYRLHHG